MSVALEVVRPAVPPGRGPSALDVQEVSAFYGTSQALFDVSLLVPATGGLAVLGRNGAGKTTLMKTIAGEMKAASGRMFLGKSEITALPTEQRIRSGIGYVPQEGAVFAKLSVRENLKVGSLMKPKSDAMDRVMAMFPKLGTRLDQQAGTLSGGERKMLAVGRALLGEPRLLILDEPTEGVWIGVIEELADRLGELSKTMALIIVEQHLDLALRVATHALVMARGRVVLEGGAGEIGSHPELLRYLAP